MSPKRGDRAAPPAVGKEFEIRFATAEAAKGWEQLAHQAPANLRKAFDVIRSDPRAGSNPDRHHRLKGELGSATWKGAVLERWQYEVTNGGRIWFLVDDDGHTVWITYAGTGHPKATD
ncbi:type II toxin-antitoxin system RelE family toxin [Nocardia sp. Marseille-Q1738]